MKVEKTMNANEIFYKMIGSELEGLVVSYTPYNENFKVHPYRENEIENFEKHFSALLFDSIVFYAFEKEEIEKDYKKGRFENLRKASRAAYETRVPKTEKENDGLFGELALDSFLKCFFPNMEMLYSRVKYLEKYPKKEIEKKRTGHEVKGYDGLLFSIENNQKYMWVGQVKTGDWQYCLCGIKNDINKSILKHYFSSAMVILADIMKAVSDRSKELLQIIDDLNDLIFEHSTDEVLLHSKIINYFKDADITVRIPCLIIAEEREYSDKNMLLNIIKKKITEGFKDFNVVNNAELKVEILLLIFPVRDIKKIRSEFLEARKEI